MPPRKKARTTPSVVTSPPTYPSTPAPAPSSPRPVPSTLKQTPVTTTPANPSTSNNPNDPWTSAQETDLFKALIRYKPTGIHKHFHMLCVSSFLRSHGHCLLPPPSLASVSSAKGTENSTRLSAEESTESENILSHTRIPGIWARLHTLYDLEALDEREDASTIGPPEQQTEDWVADGDTTREFTLPDDTDAGFDGLIWRKRWRGEGEAGGKDTESGDDDEKEGNLSSSPPAMEVMRGRDGKVISEDEMSPIRGKGRKGRGRAKAAPRETTPAVPKRQAATRGAGRRGGRPSVAPVEREVTPSEESEKDEEASDGGEEAEEEEEDESESPAEGGASDRGTASEASKEEEGEESGDAKEEESVEVPAPPMRGTRSKAARGVGRGTGKRGRGRGGRT